MIHLLYSTGGHLKSAERVAVSLIVNYMESFRDSDSKVEAVNFHRVRETTSHGREEKIFCSYPR